MLWHKYEYNPGSVHYYLFIITFIFILLLKEIKIKIFLWVPKSIVGPQHRDPHA